MSRHRETDWMMGLGMGVGAFLGAKWMVNRMRRLDLRGRVVLVTGGSRGLGLLLAKEFAEHGARVAICARDGRELERAQRQFACDRQCLWTYVCDVTRKDQVEEMVEGVRRDLGQVDVLVNNAGVIEVGPVETMTLADYESAMATNFWAAVYVTRAVVDSMRRRGGGRIVNITSIGGKIAIPHLLPYSASKFALVGWSSGLRAELKDEGIFVTTVVPGLMRTGSPRNADFKGRHEREYAWFSIMDSLPLTSMCAHRAASRIVRAAVNGEAEVTLSIQAKLATTFAALFPNTTSHMMTWVNRALPDEGADAPREIRKGRESESEWAPSVLTALGDRAARENNEV